MATSSVDSNAMDLSADASGGSAPLFYPATHMVPEEFLRRKRYLNAADDLIGRFGLLPLYNQAVLPYIRQRPAGSAVAGAPITQGATAPGMSPGTGAAQTVTQSPANPAGTPAGLTSSTPAFLAGTSPVPGAATALSANAMAAVAAAPPAAAPRQPMPKTYAEYVSDLPGRVRPPKSAFRHGLRPSTLHKLLLDETPTMYNIQPFEPEVLDAYRADPGPVAGIDASLLESDERNEEGGSGAGGGKRKGDKGKKEKKRKRDLDGPSPNKSASALGGSGQGPSQQPRISKIKVKGKKGKGGTGSGDGDRPVKRNRVQ